MSELITTIRILVVADDPLARAGLALILGDLVGCEVVGQIAGTDEIISQANVFRADVVVWDLGWDPEMLSPVTPETWSSGVITEQSPLERLNDLSEMLKPIIVLLVDETHLAEVWRAGVQGLLFRDANPEQFASALQSVLNGLVVVDPAFSEIIFPTTEENHPLPPVESLTPRELEVVGLLAEGLSNKAIARQLEISEHTVKFHVNAIMGKLGAQSRTEAVVLASRLGLVML